MSLIKSYAVIKNAQGFSLRVPLESDGNIERGSITVDGVHCHIERMSQQRLASLYRVDDDPNYTPASDSLGRCILVVPFSE